MLFLEQKQTSLGALYYLTIMIVEMLQYTEKKLKKQIKTIINH